MNDAEAMWMNFHADTKNPVAIQVSSGLINVLTGHSAKEETLSCSPQNYIVAPPQPWLDGIKSVGQTVKQFVASTLGQQITVEAQSKKRQRHAFESASSSSTDVFVAEDESVGGIQIAVRPQCSTNFTIHKEEEEKELCPSSCFKTPLELGFAPGLY